MKSERVSPRRQGALWRNMLARVVILVILPVLLVSTSFVIKNQSDASAAFDAAHRQIAEQAEGAIAAYVYKIQETAIALESDSVLTVFLARPYARGSDYLAYSGTVNHRLKYAIEALDGATVRVFMNNGTIPDGFGVFNSARYLRADPLFAGFLNDAGAKDAWFSLPAGGYSVYHPLAHSADSLLYIRKLGLYGGAELGYAVALFPIQSLAEKSGVSASSAWDPKSGVLSLYYASARPDPSGALRDGDEGVSEGAQYSVRALSGVPLAICVYTARHDDAGYVALPLGMLLMAMALLALFTRHLRGVVGSVERLIGAAGEAISGDMRYRLPSTGDADMDMIVSSVNVLLDRLAALRDESLRQQDAMREAQLLALQHQINPHFIYNTVELLAGRMELKGMYDESDALTDFAGLFRYSLNVNDAETTLAMELQNVERYLRIQRISRPGIRLTSDVDPELLDLPMPRFIFQPLVENSILHGQAQPSQSLRLRICAKAEGGAARVRVEDDGVGMTAERRAQLEALLALGAEDRARRSVGIFNIHLRLKLLYGAGLRIESAEGQGTRVAFDIPIPAEKSVRPAILSPGAQDGMRSEGPQRLPG